MKNILDKERTDMNGKQENLEKFKTDFENALSFLSQGQNLNLLEKLADNFVIANQSNHNSLSLINFQVNLLELFGEKANPIFSYLKNDIDVNYNSNHKQAFRRLENLRKLSKKHINNAEKALTLPNELHTAFFLYTERNPYDIKMTLVNNDQTSFSTEMDFNGGLNLVHDLLNNLDEKLKRGNNDINSELIESYREITNRFLDSLHNVLHENNENC
jgi:hypothetical protein